MKDVVLHDWGYERDLEETAPLPVLNLHPEDDIERTQVLPVLVIKERRMEAVAMFSMFFWRRWWRELF